MAIRIREVHIKATVRDDEPHSEQEIAHQQIPVDIQSIVAACVEQVMRKIREKEER